MYVFHKCVPYFPPIGGSMGKLGAHRPHKTCPSPHQGGTFQEVAYHHDSLLWPFSARGRDFSPLRYKHLMLMINSHTGLKKKKVRILQNPLTYTISLIFPQISLIQKALSLPVLQTKIQSYGVYQKSLHSKWGAPALSLTLLPLSHGLGWEANSVHRPTRLREARDVC